MAKKRTAKKRAASPTRRRTMSAAPRRRVRRKSTRRKKGFLSAVGTETKTAVNAMFSNALGGVGYLVFEDQVVNGSTTPWTPEKKGLIGGLGLSYVCHVMLGKPNLGGGVMGAAAYDFFKTKGLLGLGDGSQMNRQQWADPLQNVPVMLSDDQMYLAQGGGMYLQDGNGNTWLADGKGNYLPAYADTTNY